MPSRRPLCALVIVVLLFPTARSAADDGALVASIREQIPDETWASYVRQNREEDRYAEYRDNEEELALKLAQLAYINSSRSRYGAGPLELDILASRVANRQAMEACLSNFTGHWNTRGEKPYHRWAFAGGRDHVQENASALWSGGSIPQDLGYVLRSIREAHDRFMAERSPNDGHKRAVIAREHTHVGIGFYRTEQQLRYYEEYLDRYLSFLEVPDAASVGQPVSLAVRPLEPRYHVYALATYYEPYPAAMTPAQVRSRGSYPDYTNTREHTIWPWELQADSERVTRIDLAFARAGLYYVQIYLDTKPPPAGGGADTRGKIQASGIVVRVK